VILHPRILSKPQIGHHAITLGQLHSPVAINVNRTGQAPALWNHE
jgi:hypothetical protein